MERKRARGVGAGSPPGSSYWCKTPGLDSIVAWNDAEDTSKPDNLDRYTASLTQSDTPSKHTYNVMSSKKLVPGPIYTQDPQ